MPVGAVHVWAAQIAGSMAVCDVPMDGLSPDERARAQAARSPAYRTEYVLTRLVLRELLGAYLQLSPSEIRVRYNEHGKPMLAPPLDQALQFNVSHCAGIALLAFTCGRELGVDVDRLDRVSDWQAVAQRNFSPEECATLAAMPESVRREACTRTWIRKEAYAKARGAGFSYGFTRFTVSATDCGEASGLRADTQDVTAPQGWWLRDLDMGSSMAASLAAEQGASALRCWRLSVARATLAAP